MMQSRWVCPKCNNEVVSHVTGTRQVSHKCPNTLDAVNFSRVERSKYDLMK